jgi:hypothetical protein
MVVNVLLSGCTTNVHLLLYCMVVNVWLSGCTSTCTLLCLYMYSSRVVNVLLSDCTCTAFWLYNVHVLLYGALQILQSGENCEEFQAREYCTLSYSLILFSFQHNTLSYFSFLSMLHILFAIC